MSYANSKTLPESLLISHVEHPQIAAVMSKLKRAYGSLGIEVEFIAIPSQRELLAVSQGDVDGMAARSVYIKSELNNAIRVSVPLLETRLHLICRLEVVCDNRILDDPNITVAIPSGLSVNRLALERSPVKKLSLTKSQQLIEMVVNGRIDYALFVIAMTGKEMRGDYKIQIAQPALFQANIYHYLHSRHTHIVPLIENALKVL